MNTSAAKDFNVLIMAAGAARRFGSCKLLAPLQSKPVITHSLDVLTEFAFNKIVIASGAFHTEITDYLERNYNRHSPTKFTIIECKHWQSGLGRTIAEAYQSIKGDKPLLITLADLPFINNADINFLLQQSTLNPTKMVAAFNGNSLSPPVIFPVQYLDQLNHLSGDFGAKSLINRYPDQVLSLTLKNAAFDIDTPQQLQHAHK